MILDLKQKQDIISASEQVFTLLDQNLVVYKIFNFLDSQTDSLSLQDKILTLPLCNLYFINCLSIHSAYLLEIPGFHLDIHKNYLRIRRGEALEKTNFQGAHFVHQDKNLNIIHSDDGATLISPNNLKWIIKPEMVRKTTSKD